MYLNTPKQIRGFHFSRRDWWPLSMARTPRTPPKRCEHGRSPFDFPPPPARPPPPKKKNKRRRREEERVASRTTNPCNNVFLPQLASFSLGSFLSHAPGGAQDLNFLQSQLRPDTGVSTGKKGPNPVVSNQKVQTPARLTHLVCL